MVTVPDPKWLEFLKAGLPAFFGLAAFAAATLYLDKLGFLPMPLPVALALTIAVVGLLSGCLAVGLLLEAAYKASAWFIRPRYLAYLDRKLTEKRKREFIAYVPHLSERERLIFAYLLHHNQRTFENTPDCGHAATLLALGYVQLLVAPSGSQQYDYYAVPFGVPDPVWDALVARREEFKLGAQEVIRARVGRTPPWRVPVTQTDFHIGRDRAALSVL